ncbi:MAG: GNAT family N-acetyltransferase [Eisenbergiella sp.]
MCRSSCLYVLSMPGILWKRRKKICFVSWRRDRCWRLWKELVVGFIGTRGNHEPYGWELHPLAVEERSGKKGIGSLLIKEIEKEAVNRGAIVMYLGTDDEDGATSLSEGDLFIEYLSENKKY